MSGGLIKPIDKASVHRICSGQVIRTLEILNEACNTYSYFPPRSFSIWLLR